MTRKYIQIQRTPLECRRLGGSNGIERGTAPVDGAIANLALELNGEPHGQHYRLTLRVVTADGREIGRLTREDVHPSWVEGWWRSRMISPTKAGLWW